MDAVPDNIELNNMAAQPVSPMILPVITIQHTFPEVIQEVLDGIIPSDKFWVSCYKTSEPSVHAKVHVELDEINRNLVNLSPVEDAVEVLKAPSGVSVFLILSQVSFPPISTSSMVCNLGMIYSSSDYLSVTRLEYHLFNDSPSSPYCAKHNRVLMASPELYSRV